MRWRSFSRGAALLMAGHFVAIGCRAYDRGEYEALTSADASVSPVGDASSCSDGSSSCTTACTVDAGVSSPCDFLPPFPGTQILDGNDDDFCGVPQYGFGVAQGRAAFVNDQPAPVQNTDAKATLRVGWSALGLHAFAHLTKAPISTAPADEPIYSYDALEFVVAGNSQLTGPFGGDVNTDLGSLEVIVAPPANGRPATAGFFQVNGHQTGSLVYGQQFAARLTDDGFDAEVLIAWGILGRQTPPLSGTIVAFDFGVSLRIPDPDGGTEHLLSWLGMLDVKVTGQSGCWWPSPFCDDRYWCTPILQ